MIGVAINILECKADSMSCAKDGDSAKGLVHSYNFCHDRDEHELINPLYI